eukprot:CAMPEP_0171485976 /NCGR_PEP_ID=MMETSP0958-20121227/837_1 /TAXON_ID=87120 /ORGANISM="Aurantiochytrium limacinum, Strain ATCCMYA-1381" /LENGTH=35 /DNA_ID= /DNA_START= /DNA_END= /DNA_ORIENTATION=
MPVVVSSGKAVSGEEFDMCTFGAHGEIHRQRQNGT